MEYKNKLQEFFMEHGVKFILFFIGCSILSTIIITGLVLIVTYIIK